MRESVGTVASIVRDDLGACPDRAKIKVYDTLGDCWHEMPVGMQGSGDATVWWMIDAFVESREERSRIHRALLGVDLFFANLSRLTGGIRVPKRLREALKRHILMAMYPTGWEVVKGATGHNATQAKKNLLKHVPLHEWGLRTHG